MTADGQPTAGPTPRRLRPAVLVVGALLLVVVPAVAGIIALRNDSGGEETAPAMGDRMAAGSGQIADLNEIIVGNVTIEVDDATGTATVLLTTSIDVVCAVSYGPTPELGFLATDTDMAGTGHSDHHPLLVGLEPDTTYSYRLSAIADDGTLYRSELMTFSTGAGAQVALPGPNVAVEATVIDVSSEFSAAFGASLAIDGDLGTEWSTAGDGDGAYITLDLGGPTEVTGVGFRTRSMTDGTSITLTFTVTVDDGEPQGPFAADLGLAVVPLEFTGRIVRFDVETSTGGNTGAIEIEVYGSSVLAPVVTSGMGDS